MQANFYLAPLAICLTATMSSSSQAAQQVPLHQDSFKHLQQQFQLALPGTTQTSVISPNRLQFIQQRVDRNQITHIRMQQQYEGLPVYGGYAILHSQQTLDNLLMPQNKVWMNGTIYHGLRTELGRLPNDFIKRAPLALQQFKASYQGMALGEEQVIPIVYIDDEQRAHWAYRVSVDIYHEHRIPERATAIIDSKSYQPFVQWDDIKTSGRLAVKGTGYGGNAKTGGYLFGKTHPLLDLTYDKKQQVCYMSNASVKVVDMKHEYFSANEPMSFDCKAQQYSKPLTFWTGYQGDGYDKENGAFSPTNDALYSGYIIKHMYQDWYGIEVLSKRGKPMQLVMRVHFGEGYGNAYWDGKQMTFGDGDSLMYPLVSLGIGAHEISHGFTQQHANLEYRGHSGGLNESFSDMAAQAAEFYSTGKNSWLIGAEIMRGRYPLRYMDKPSRDGHSIDSADQYYQGLDVHYSSGVFNHLFYLLATTPGWDTHKAFNVMVKANMDYWTPNITFNEAGCGVLQAARDLGFSLDDIQKALTEVAVNYEFCFKAALQNT